METLNEFNERRRATYWSWREGARPNGIACSCGGELFDTQPNAALTTDPPQKTVHCNECGFTGHRVA